MTAGDPENAEKNTDSLISNLCSDLKPCHKMRHPLLRIGPWLFFAFLYVLVTVGVQGYRFDLSERLVDSNYVFEIFLVTLMSVSAACSAVWLCIPDMRGQRWILSIPITLFSCFVFLTLSRMVLGGFEIPVWEWCFCYESAVLYGVLPAFAIVFLSKKGKTTHPYLLAFMVSVAVGGLGYLGLRLVCPSEDIGHLVIKHVLPYFLFGVVAALIGRHIYRW